jgi:hypothetical protein
VVVEVGDIVGVSVRVGLSVKLVVALAVGVLVGNKSEAGETGEHAGSRTISRIRVWRIIRRNMFNPSGG